MLCSGINMQPFSSLLQLHRMQFLFQENWPWMAATLLIIISIFISTFYLRRFLQGQKCSSKRQLDGKTIVVTGSNIGIGKEAAHDFYRRGARVILACRNMDSAAEAAREIQSTLTSSKGEVVIRHLDLANFDSIRKFVKDILATENRIDILVNNAGLFADKGLTDDGFDVVFQTNHLGHFLLTNLLLDKIKASAPSRIINLSSKAYEFGQMHWDDLNLNEEGSYGPMKAYSQSKLANILFTKELAQRLKGTGVTVYAVHPGAVRTGLGRNSSDFLPVLLNCLLSAAKATLFKDVKQGAQTTIHCAVCEKADNQTGLFYCECRPAKPKRHARDDAAAKMLWDVSAEMVNLKD